ncbi:MAG: protein kinase [Sandaracinaceae bacterium]|nr:protein kinase [Sandaracinaceae bacterium]
MSLPDTTAQSQKADEFPRRFGKYALLRKFATGGMAELFLALQRSVAGFEKMLVVKRILPNLAQDKNFITMLLREARIAATLNHPNIAHIYDVGVENGEYYIAMEHVHGEDLRSIVRAMKQHQVREFPLEHALAIVLGCAAGLAYAHEQRSLDGQHLAIVHRDISPQNILVTFNGDVKLVDFGIAIAARGNQDVTSSGKLKGKAPYMSPEQAQGLPLDARSDVFSLGVILFELATGKRLFRGPTEFDTFKLIISEPYPAPCAVNPRLAPKLGAIIERALARNPNDRYQSARELQADLEEYVRTAQLSVSALSLSTWMRSLFEEKLTVQEQMLREGQKLADVLAQQAAEEELLRVTDRVSFLPSLAPRPGPPEERGWGKMLIGMLLVLLVAGGTFWYLRRLAASESGAIVVRTDPPGAAIWIDGDRRPERTPATLHGLPVGVTYAVKLTLDGFAPLTQQLPLTQNEPHGAVVVRLEPDGPPPASIARITTTPRGAAVFLDGHDTGQRTPATLTEVRPGVEHRVECILDGYVPAHLVFTTSAGEALDRVVPLERTELRSDEALLIVRVSPPDARVNVLGEWHEGGSPYELRVPARPTRIFVNRVRHYDTDRLVDLAGGRVTEVEFTLTRERGAEEDERADILGSTPRPAAAPAAQDTPVADDARDPGPAPAQPAAESASP